MNVGGLRRVPAGALGPAAARFLRVRRCARPLRTLPSPDGTASLAGVQLRMSVRAKLR